MRWPRIIFIALVLLIFGAFLHYTLPQRDVVRVTGTEIIRQDFSGLNRIFYAQGDSGNAQPESRDLRLINAAFPDRVNEAGEEHARRVMLRNRPRVMAAALFQRPAPTAMPRPETQPRPGRSRQWFRSAYGWRRALTTYPKSVETAKMEGRRTNADRQKCSTLNPRACHIASKFFASGTVQEPVTTPARTATARRWAKPGSGFGQRRRPA